MSLIDFTSSSDWSRLFDFGFTALVPLRSGSKRPDRKWARGSDWRTALDQHGRLCVAGGSGPVAVIMGPELLALDADTADALECLRALEEAFSVVPAFVQRTPKGEHHVYRLAPGTHARMAGFDSRKTPWKIDVRHGESYIVMATGDREVVRSPAGADGLTVVDQMFVDAIFTHNGKPAPRPRQAVSSSASGGTPASLEEAAEILSHIDPDCGYDEWYEIGMGVHSLTQGSDDGLQLFDAWSAGGGKYAGFDEIARKWDTFVPGKGIGWGTVCHHAQASGANMGAISRRYGVARAGFGGELPAGAVPAPPGGTGESNPISEAARQLAEAIAFRLNKHIPDMTVTPDTGVIQRMIDGCFWSGSKSKLFVFNNQQSLNQYTSSDAVAAMSRWFGPIVDRSVIESNAARYEMDDREISKLCTLPTAIVLHHLQDHNQRESVEWRVDMFADEPRMDINEDIVKVILTHKPFRVDGSYSQRIIDDYKKHFTRLDEFLKLIAMAKFAIDRKKAYLWIHASSDWGKGMLINGVLGSLGAVVETSTKEIETLFEGRPVGKSPIEFKRCCALVVDEFKSVKSELKQLQNTMTLSPKNQLSSTVEIFAKVFMSAESVNSLVTENGVEDQFANRMSIFEEHGSIESRALWATEGKARYTENVRSYAAHFLNTEIARLQSLGREAATAEADQWLVDFHGRYGIGNTHGRFSDTLLTVAKDMIEWINRPANRTGLEQSGKLVADGGEWYLCHPGTVISEYIDGHYDSTERGAYMKRKRDLQALLSADGRGVVNHRIAGSARKCILLRKPDDDPTARALRNAAYRD